MSKPIAALKGGTRRFFGAIGHFAKKHKVWTALIALAFAIGDSAAGYAALSVLPDGAEVVTVEMKINLLSPAVGDRLVAEGRVIRPGRRIVAVASDVFAEGDKGRKHVATLLGTMVPVES